MQWMRCRHAIVAGALVSTMVLTAGCEPYAEKAAREEAESAAQETTPPPEPEPVRTTSSGAAVRPAGSALGGAVQNAQNLVEQHNQRQEDLEDLMEQ